MTRLIRTIAGRKVQIISHQWMHLDELFAMWLVKKFAKAAFLNQYAPEGKLLLGVGNGPFDEHPSGGQARKADETCCTLVAKALGVENRPELRQLLQYVASRDLKAGGASDPLTFAFDFSRMIKPINRRYKQVGVLRWAFMGFEAVYVEALRFQEALEELRQQAEVERIWVNGRSLPVVTIVSDNHQIQRAARIPAKFGGLDAAVIVQQQTTGHVQVFTNHKYGVNLDEVVAIVRYNEQLARGPVVTNDRRALEEDGSVPGAEVWFYLKEGNTLLNGSETAPEVEPTKLSLEQIQEAVRDGLTFRQ